MSNSYNPFIDELKLIKSHVIRQFTIDCLAEAPDYFWTLPASTGGEHHATDEIKEGGLILHTRRVVRMCQHLIGMSETLWTPKLEDKLISAAILHDTFRCGRKGREKYCPKIRDDPDSELVLCTDSMHPLYPAWELKEIAEKYGDFAQEILQAIAQHYGRWLKIKVETSGVGRVLHMADYIASRRDVHIDLDQGKDG
jgi:HD superfamily phosphohydrolase YqeK